MRRILFLLWSGVAAALLIGAALEPADGALFTGAAVGVGVAGLAGFVVGAWLGVAGRNEVTRE